MKRVVSVLILMILIFLTFQWGFVFFKKGHEVSYQVSAGDIVFEIDEIYHKDQDDTYDILIEGQGYRYSYFLTNHYNKQKRIIEKIESYQEGDSYCIYPVLANHQGTYLQCTIQSTLYTDSSFPNQDFIAKIKSDLKEKGYVLSETISESTPTIMGGSTIYSNHLLLKDTIVLWNYKGIEIINTNFSEVRNILDFDKYENSHGYLVGKYYIVPNYFSSKVLEFSSVTLIDIEANKIDTLELNDTLSADTYINGVIDGKLYLTDPSNLLQLEIHPAKRSVRLIGNTEIGGQTYQGEWQNVNIYDFKKEHIVFQKEIPEEVTTRYSYTQLLEGDMSYYFVDANKVYRVSKNHLDIPLLLFEKSGLNNIKVVGNTIYFIIDDTLYYYGDEIGILPVLKNNELRYNTVNRIDIYRKS